VANRTASVQHQGLRDSPRAYISAFMKRIFDMDDRARLPWRFFGATLTVLARL
jgi:hypothetical protein